MPRQPIPAQPSFRAPHGPTTRPLPFAALTLAIAVVILGGFEASRATLADRFSPEPTSSTQSVSPNATQTGADGEHSGSNTGGQ